MSVAKHKAFGKDWGSRTKIQLTISILVWGSISVKSTVTPLLLLCGKGKSRSTSDPRS